MRATKVHIAIFLLLFSSQLVFGESINGWKIEKYHPEEHEIVASDNLYVLTPPDFRSPITIREPQALKILAGETSPESVYRDRGIEKKLDQKKWIELEEKVMAENNEKLVQPEQLSPNETPTEISLKESKADLGASPEVVKIATWNPESDQPWPYNWEENVNACKGAAHSGMLSARSDILISLLPTFQNHPHCTKSDVEEAARRIVYQSCAGRTATPLSLREHVKAIWISPLKSFNDGGVEKPIFFVIGECKNGWTGRSVATFSLPNAKADKCWACGSNSSREDYVSGTILEGLDRNQMFPLDLEKKRRTSPAISEALDSQIPGYWK